MKEAEKLDIILRGLYEYRSTDSYVSPAYFLPEITLEDDVRMSRWLLDEGLVKGTITMDGARLKITSDGVMYCEEDSASQPGNPITMITYIQAINSPGATMQVGIQGQILYSNKIDIQRQIDEMRIELDTLSGISAQMVSEIGECLDEIAAKVEDRKPVPSFIWDWLGRIDTITSLADKVFSLKALINP